MKRLLLSGSQYGKLLMLVGALIGVPLAVLPFYRDEVKYAPAFIIPMCVSVIVGLLICAATYRKQESVSEWQSPLQRGSLPVLFVWVYSIIAGAVPFALAGKLDFVHSLFESVSGWTTTGLTVVDVTDMPKIFLFHRSFMQFCGGVGFILMIAMFVQGKHSMSIYSAEGHSDRIMPSLRQSARVVFILYCGFLVGGTLLYVLFGMELFDAICHTMSAISTAGYTTKAASIGEYGSVSIELVTVVLMLIGASNFAVLVLLTRGKIRDIMRVTEMRVMLILIAVFVPLFAISLYIGNSMGFFESMRQSLFGVVSIFTTTGYSTMDYSKMIPFAQGLIFLLMFIGGSSGSTAGGIKLSRLYFAIRITWLNIKTRMSPAHKVAVPTYNGAKGRLPIDERLVNDTFGFIACYFAVFIVGTLLLTLSSGESLFNCMYEFASALGTVGISDGLTNPYTNPASMTILMAGMTLGRLEIFIVFIGLYETVRKIKHKIKK